MKIARPFTIDEDLTDDLKGLNASSLVNELLKDYFNKNKSENLKILNEKLNQKGQKKKEINKEIREIKKKIDKIKQKEAKILRLFNKVPQKVIEDLRQFPNMSMTSLKIRYAEVYRNKYSFVWLDLKKVFEELRGGDL